MPQDPPTAARITRRALFDAVWSKPMIEIAADHDTTAYYIVSLCKRLGLPVPPLGHWQRVAVGRGAETPPYSAADKLDAGDHAIGRPAPGLGRGGRIKAKAAETAAAPAAQPAPAATPTELHKRVKPTSKVLNRATKDVTTSSSGAGKLRVTVAVNRRPMGPPYRRAKGTPFALRRTVDAGRVFRAAGGAGRA